jgi:hypothetical protein
VLAKAKKGLRIMSPNNDGKETKKTRGAKKVRKAGKKQRRKRISKSGKPKVKPGNLNVNPEVPSLSRNHHERNSS